MFMLFNSLTKNKETFTPIIPGHVGIYLCGMTVYDYCHIGNARSWVVFDVIVRYLRHRGYKVNYVRNITDIDDKIIARAKQDQIDCDVVTEKFIQALQDDEKALGVITPDQEPRATAFIPEIIALIAKLIDQGYAYIGTDDDVYFDVRRYSPYGKLSHRLVDELLAGVRVDVREGKRDPLDFALWKRAKPGEPTWDSPWGPGRPGWHIECSAMSSSILGQPFDIHGGGLDLKFPHHENEIAQSEAALQKPFVNYWVHVGLLDIEKEKMSKSLGNIVTVRDAIKIHGAELLRFFLLSGHYRSSITYSKENLQQAANSLSRLYLAIRGLNVNDKDSSSEYTEQFYEAMDDDFNTPQAFAILFDIARNINRYRDQHQLEKAAALARELKFLGNLVGILQEDPETFLQGASHDDVEKIESLISRRNEARANKDWAAADQFRQTLLEMNIVIEDTAEGTVWRRQ